MFMQKPKVVVLGGGTGMPALLKGLKSFPIDLSVIVTVADYGGSSWKIRQDMDIPAPGDIRNVIAALANVDDEMNEMFQHRFQTNNELSGHALGNLVLVALNHMTGNFYEAVKKLANIFQVNANIIPVVNEAVVLNALMDDGSIIIGESNIPVHNKKIDRVFLTPNNVKPLPETVEAILEADVVVISPGSLYTSILPNIIISDIVKALNETKAKTMYVCNVMTQLGETNDYDATSHVQAIYNHIGPHTIDAIVVHKEAISKPIRQIYEKEQSFPVTYNIEELEQLGLEVMEEHILDPHKTVGRHNKEKSAEIINDDAKKNENGKG